MSSIESVAVTIGPLERSQSEREPVVRVSRVSKWWTRGGTRISALQRIDLEVAPGSIHGVVGMSGAGKSTLLRCIAALEKPDDGSVFIDGADWTRLAPTDLRRERQKMGVIFQHLHLLSSRTAEENIALPLELSGESGPKRRDRARELLHRFGLADKADVYPAQLSGGQRQRVALARALATKPRILLADEPTSAMDYVTRDSALKVLQGVREDFGVTILIITHDLNAARSICDTVSVLSRGTIVATGSPSQVLAESGFRRASAAETEISL